jgi:putative spermidine/putrescine transport system ATP-binding protein
MSAELRVQGLRKSWGAFELRADFEVGPGERAVLLGRSGSGKSSLLRVLAGLEPWDPAADSGQIWLGEQELTHCSPEQRQIGVVFQDQALFPALDLIDNASFGLMMRGVSRLERQKQAEPWLDRVGLLRQIGTPVDRLSGGERQRLAFVRAWVWNPRLLLLDEPFSALDPGLRGVLRRELLELHALWPVPLLLVTHDEADAEELGTFRIRLHEESDGITRQFRRE